MNREKLRKKAHDAEVTVWVGKRGLEAVSDELDEQLDERDLVKVKFLRAARGTDDVDDLADELADLVGAEVVDTRGHTTVLYR
jgi:RNA-binding protein